MTLSQVTWVDRTEDLAARIEAIGDGPLCLDTEADSFHHYHEKVCLVQLSFGGRDLLVDPLAGTDLGILGPVLADSGVRKILHGADYDLRMLDRDFSLEIHGLFDTMLAARLVGERAFGLAALLAKYLDVRLDKRFQRADWSLRPLTPEMEAYAVMDTRHLEALAGRLEERLEELGRSAWAAEEFRRLEKTRWSERPADEDPCARVKGARRLDRRGRAVLRELLAWRDEGARRRDVPRFRILRDEVLLQLAESRPGSAAELAAACRLPRSCGPRDAGRLMEAVAAGLAVPEADLPPPPERSVRARPTPEAQARLKQACRRRDRVAEDLNLEPSVLAPRAVIEQALAFLDEGRAIEEVAGLRRWQAELLEPVLEA